MSREIYFVKLKNIRSSSLSEHYYPSTKYHYEAYRPCCTSSVFHLQQYLSNRLIFVSPASPELPRFHRLRNERERSRVRSVNFGFARLRNMLPPDLLRKRMSKLQILNAAILYIHQLRQIVQQARAVQANGDMGGW